jgi:hypothetical protein
MFTVLLHSNRRHNVPLVCFCGNVFPNPLPSSGCTCNTSPFGGIIYFELSVVLGQLLYQKTIPHLRKASFIRTWWQGQHGNAANTGTALTGQEDYHKARHLREILAEIGEYIDNLNRCKSCLKTLCQMHKLCNTESQKYCHVFRAVTSNNGFWIGWLNLLTPSFTITLNHQQF